ncbi:adhesion G protein-coupled receptor E1-like [Pseudorasbora parva]|uniref:adhesion G protein-coupled receptor E1-like n=1 Tax=Pseudorasbora parva TaxID=51549 RepID=UPI00351EECF2
MSIAVLRSRLQYLRRGGAPSCIPRSSGPPAAKQRAGTLADDLGGDLRVTVRANPTGLMAPRPLPPPLCRWSFRKGVLTSHASLHAPWAGLFGNAIEDFAQQFSVAKKQTEAIKNILPWRPAAASTQPPGQLPSLLVTEGVPRRPPPPLPSPSSSLHPRSRVPDARGPPNPSRVPRSWPASARGSSPETGSPGRRGAALVWEEDRGGHTGQYISAAGSPESSEVEVFMVGPQVTLDEIPRLETTNYSLDIDLIGIAKNSNETRIFCFCHTGSAAVAFMSYNTMENLLKPDFFNTSNDTIKTMMSTVISATLPKTTNTKLTKPVNFTLRHIREFDPSGSLSCVYWNISEWIVDGCSVLETNSSFTVCSCVHLSTFALIMQTSRPPESESLMDLLNLVCVIVGLVFFSLALLTFALCQWSPGVNNVARINLCVSLLLAHLLFLLTQQFLSLIRREQVLCAMISGLHFLFLSSFVWMSIEAVLLFICVRNLSQIWGLHPSSKKREVLSSGFLCVIGYTVALVVVSVSVGLLPEGYGSEPRREKC